MENFIIVQKMFTTFNGNIKFTLGIFLLLKRACIVLLASHQDQLNKILLGKNFRPIIKKMKT